MNPFAEKNLSNCFHIQSDIKMQTVKIQWILDDPLKLITNLE